LEIAEVLQHVRILEALVFLQILQDCPNEETQMRWKKEMLDMS
jgi:hypothetical protein